MSVHDSKKEGLKTDLKSVKTNFRSHMLERVKETRSFGGLNTNLELMAMSAPR